MQQRGYKKAFISKKTTKKVAIAYSLARNI